MSTAAPSPSSSSIPRRSTSPPAACAGSDTAYIIRNARLDPDYAASERRTLSIAGRAIGTMLATSGRNDVLRTYFVSQRDKVDYNLAYIGSDFSAPKSGEFDQSYMRALYAYGERQALVGRAWHKTPPGLTGPQ